ncbi:tetratricopeptide repeat protein [Thermodesulfobacteriota bacterium]
MTDAVKPSVPPSTEKEEATELKKLRRRAEEGDAEAQFRLGLKYEYGLDVVKDPEQALKWYQKSAENGSKVAQQAIARLTVKDSGQQSGTEHVEDEKSETRAEQSETTELKRLAQEGDPQAQYRLAKTYVDQPGRPTDFFMASEWLIRAADNVHPRAMGQLKDLANKTLASIEETNLADWKWAKGVKLTLPEGTPQPGESAFTLGLRYSLGIGVPRNDSKALEYIFKSAIINYSMYL